MILRQYTAPSGIKGRVTDSSRSAIAQINVAAANYESVLTCEGSGDFWASIDADGTYQLDLPPGTYLVYINSHSEPNSCVPQAYRGVGSWLQIANAARVTADGRIVPNVNLGLEHGLTISGRLVDSRGDPVLGAGGFIIDPAQGIEFTCSLGFGTSDSDGTFRINLPTGEYDLGFCPDAVCHVVIPGLDVSDHAELGDVLFAEAD